MRNYQTDAIEAQLRRQIEEAGGDVAAHLADASGAHAATAVSFTPAGTIAATTVQAAIEEVATEATGIAATIVDAKGDLIAATAADTVARLAAGANDTILMADSGETTGLKWVASGTPSTQAFGDSAVVGTADTFTRGDHKHAMPADPVTAHAAAADPHAGYVLESLLNAKGDLISASADNTPSLVTVGANDTILMADSGQAAGLKWVASAAPVAVGTAAAEGTSDDYSRASHVHAHEAAHVAHDTVWAAKGDLVGGTGSDTAAILTVGTDDHVLTAASGEATGLKWAAVAAGGSVATDAIWDAKGDLAGGTGANTAAKLTVGADDTILMADAAAATGLKWVASATPVAVGSANAAGTSDDFARGSHVHTYDPPRCAAYQSAAQTALTNDAEYKVNCNTEEWDTGFYDNATNYRITPTVAGKYLLAFNVSCYPTTSPNGRYFRVNVKKNGADFKFFHSTFVTVGGLDRTDIHGTTIVDMNGSTDYLELFAKGSVTVGTWVLDGTQPYTYFSCVRVAI